MNSNHQKENNMVIEKVKYVETPKSEGGKSYLYTLFQEIIELKTEVTIVLV